jgi:heptosyltransferase-2
MHIAAAVGRPLVAVYGSSNPNFTPPLSPNARSVSLEPSCLCFKRACQYGHTECLENLLPDRVVNALTELNQIRE